MAVNGKNKGNTFERKIANVLSARFKDVLGQDKGFRRNPDSGSFFGGSNKTRTVTHNTDYAVFGDLMCPKHFRYSIECKHYKTAPSLGSIITGEVKQWDIWLTQAQQDSTGSNRKMLLVVKYNNVDEFIFVTEQWDTLPCKIQYKGLWVYRLEDFLGLTNATFFDLASVEATPPTA